MKIMHYDPKQDKDIPVELTDANTELNPVKFEEGGPTDEGYHYRCTRYYMQDGEAMCDVDTRSCDCDGPMTTWGTYVYRGGIWEELNGGQRDYYAEQMGY